MDRGAWQATVHQVVQKSDITEHACHTLYSNHKMAVTFPQAKDKEVRGTKLVVTGLKEGAFYKFRVRAVNIAGIGEPGEVTDAIEMKDRLGNY